MAKDLYMVKTEALLNEGKATLARLRAGTEKAGAEARVEAERRLGELEERYAVAARCFEQLQQVGIQGVADLKVTLEKAWDAFRAGVKSPDAMEQR